MTRTRGRGGQKGLMRWPTFLGVHSQNMWNELERSIREASKEAVLSKLPKTESSKHIERLHGTSHGTSQQYFRGKEKGLYTKQTLPYTWRTVQFEAEEVRFWCVSCRSTWLLYRAQNSLRRKCVSSRNAKLPTTVVRYGKIKWQLKNKKSC